MRVAVDYIGETALEAERIVSSFTVEVCDFGFAVFESDVRGFFCLHVIVGDCRSWRIGDVDGNFESVFGRVASGGKLKNAFNGGVPTPATCVLCIPQYIKSGMIGLRPFSMIHKAFLSYVRDLQVKTVASI